MSDLIRLPNGRRVLRWLSPDLPSAAFPAPPPPPPLPPPPPPPPDDDGDDYEYLRVFDVVSFSAQAQQRFLSFAAWFIADRGGSASASDLVRASAFRCKISTETAKRYLSKFSAPLPDAPLVLSGGRVSIRGR